MYIIANGNGEVSNMFMSVEDINYELNLSGDCSYDTVIVFNSKGKQVASLYKQFNSRCNVTVSNITMYSYEKDACNEIEALLNSRDTESII
jgi:hypothetical protein